MTRKTTSEVIENTPEGTDADEALAPRRMATTLKRYRGAYEPVVSATGKMSMDNGKPVAVALRGLSHGEVHEIAEALLGFTPGALAAKYGHLNAGQQRMNSGNRLNNSWKKGLVALEDIVAQADAVKDARE